MTDLAGLRRVALQAGYRMLGNRTEAEDIAQDAMLRVVPPIERGEVTNPEAYTTTVATRLAIDHLRSARVRREDYVGPWLPEPLIERSGDPAELADSLSYGLMVVLETLGPVERAAFLLHDVFGFEYGEVADALDRNEVACRQLVSRARQRIADDRPRLPVDLAAHRKLLEQFLRASTLGDVEGLRELLTDDAMLISDGGANVRAARYPVRGNDRVARFVAKVAPSWLLGELKIVTINGETGFLVELDGVVDLAGTVELRDGRIATLRWVRNPDKLPR